MTKDKDRAEMIGLQMDLLTIYQQHYFSIKNVKYCISGHHMRGFGAFLCQNGYSIL